MASQAVQELNEAEFDQAVASGVTLVDFWAPWCGPCRMLGPVVAELAAEANGRFAVAKVNVDDAPDLARRFGVQAIPLLVVLKDGQPVEKLVGLNPKGAILSALHNHLSD